MSKSGLVNSQSINSFQAKKDKGEKLVMLTAYDYAMARAVSQTETDIILVGDSLGMVVLGYSSTLQVTMDEMVSHTAAVRRGAPERFIIADLPYMSYHLSPAETKANAARLITEGGADAVKLEGGSQARLEAIRSILDCEIPVCAHIGLTPQSVHIFGGYKVQGKGQDEAARLLAEARQVEQAGAFLLVLEGIPEALGKSITSAAGIPTIGIGAGRFCDGQVLVFHDMLGWSDLMPKFVRQYSDVGSTVAAAINVYAQEVKNGAFPAREHVYYPVD